MNISKTKSIYSLYSLIIYLTYIVSSNIVPPIIQWISNKLLILTYFTLLLLIVDKTKLKVMKRYTSSLFLLLLFCILSIMSYLYNFSGYEAVSYSFVYSFLYFILFFIVLHVSGWFTASALLKPFLICSIIIITLSTAVFLGYEPTYYFADEEQLQEYLQLKQGGALIGFSGVYLNQNAFGMQLLIAFSSIYLTILFKNTKKAFIKKMLYFFMFLALLLAFVTLSRATIAALLIIIILFNIKNYKNKVSLYISCTLIVATLIIYLSLYDYFEFFLNRVQTRGTSSRTQIWSDALLALYDNPLFGVGNYKYVSDSGVLLSAHNVYINKLASTGIVGSLFWFLWLIYIITLTLKNYINNVTYNNAQIFLSCIIVGILIHQIVENTIHYTYSTLTIFFIVTASSIIVKATKD